MTTCSGTTLRYVPLEDLFCAFTKRDVYLSNACVYSILQARVDEFVSRVQEKALSYQGEDVMLPMGSDFMYQDADRWSNPVFCT
jgi:hypothetical protein